MGALKYVLVILLTLASPALTLADTLPRLLHVSSPDCHSCRFVHSELKKLRSLNAARLQFETLNIARDPEQARHLEIHMVPTLIFYDRSGKEVFRHLGPWSAEEIGQKWIDLGLELQTSRDT